MESATSSHAITNSFLKEGQHGSELAGEQSAVYLAVYIYKINSEELFFHNVHGFFIHITYCIVLSAITASY